MNDDNVRRLVRNAMVEAGIVEKSGISLSHFHEGREYLILVTAIDVTDWGKNSEDE
jgi:hypothetical protein